MEQPTCYHCGTLCDIEKISFQEKYFCCLGCKTVYQLFSDNRLDFYYQLENRPGVRPSEEESTFGFLKNKAIVDTLIDFEDGQQQVVTLHIPQMHCSSCIWILENLHRLDSHILDARVHFASRKATFRYKTDAWSLHDLVSLLHKIGYAPHISLQDGKKATPPKDRRPLYRLALAGFAFGNVMLMSFPEYFEVNEFWLDQYKPFFRWLMFALSVPVLLYAARPFFISAYKGLKNRFLNIDVPIALGLLALFFQSAYEVAFDKGSGYFDTFTGLVFFMQLGRMFQQKTYDFLSFERDYKSFFPIAVTRIHPVTNEEENIALDDIALNDRLLIRNRELIPTEGILISSDASIDYSFVNGESEPVLKKSGDKLFAGGRQTAGAIEMVATTKVAQSYLTQLWEQQTFKKQKYHTYEALTDKVSQYFTPVVLLVAVLGGLAWYLSVPQKALYVFISVLIVACPCALALASPFTLGNMLRIFSKKGFFLKNTLTIERLSKIDVLVFDKTGTLTVPRKNKINYYGQELSESEIGLLSASLRQSNHPLSKELYHLLKTNNIEPVSYFNEHSGMGFEAHNDALRMRVGKKQFTQPTEAPEAEGTAVYVSANGRHRGYFVFKHYFRKGIKKMLKRLSAHYRLIILSGDKETARKQLEKQVPAGIAVYMEQSPVDKLQKIEKWQSSQKVAMIGDGLNDAGALAQSDVGIALAEDTHYFSPACDAILRADLLPHFSAYLKACKEAMRVLKFCFIVSIIYNLTGLGFALSGILSPLVAAILMPLSSITIVILSTLLTNRIGNSLN